MGNPYHRAPGILHLVALKSKPLASQGTFSTDNLFPTDSFFHCSTKVYGSKGFHISYLPGLNISGSTKTIQKSPVIYAVADGIITRIDYSFRLREMFEPALGKQVANRRYGIGLTFAREGNTGVTFHYSIEPFIDPRTNNFYDQFILVKLGQQIKKGQVIAKMYIPENRKLAEKTHIHFNLIKEGGGGFISPSIFDQKIVQEFHRRWNLFPNDPDAPIPSCMGYMLEADENPFERKVVDSL